MLQHLQELQVLKVQPVYLGQELVFLNFISGHKQPRLPFLKGLQRIRGIQVVLLYLLRLTDGHYYLVRLLLDIYYGLVLSVL